MDLRKLIWEKQLGYEISEGLCQICHSTQVKCDTYKQIRALTSKYTGNHIANWLISCDSCYKQYNPSNGGLKLMIEKGFLRQEDYNILREKLIDIIYRGCSFHVGNSIYCKQKQIDDLRPYCQYHWNDQLMPMDTS